MPLTGQESDQELAGERQGAGSTNMFQRIRRTNHLRALLTVALTVTTALSAAPGRPQAPSSGGSGGPGIEDPAVSMIVPGGEAMTYWPRWRGPSGQGLVEGADYPDTWSDTQNVLWKVGVPGRGHSSPIVWGDRILLTTAAQAGAGP